MLNKVLIITGMHRSGTSLVSEYLHHCGLHIGDDLIECNSISPMSAYNGHHEDRDFSEFHCQILKRELAHEKVYRFPTDESKLLIKITHEEEKQAFELLAFKRHLPQWGWKDPHTVLFLDFWQKKIKNAYYLFLYRQPLLVVDSLLRRGTDSPILREPIIGLKTWKIYNQEILSFVNKNKNRCLIYDIDTIIKNPYMILEKIYSNFGIKLYQANFMEKFSPAALKSEAFHSLDNLKDKYEAEVADSQNLYQQLQAASSQTTI
ncbi:MAG: hypothetical protein F6K54_36450 [Okeania sp. SIO3B5]|uniref:sulfotransferase n=1 Tax=Okeania sp. SIO3B5 TaxID=2607811 RepID=UPI0013FFDB66|nr:sulfotransferase [Okeania sp. SIO3B5]NEO58067.1 hypothetical protein [Okeania sp. SIO3B5]